MAGIYIHIPFCKQACYYCDFHFSTSLKKKPVLIQALAKEMVLRKNELKASTIETIYFGGGTPSLLSIDDIELLIDTIYKHYTVIEHPEITLEANPDDLSPQLIKNLANTPVNRLSIGIQSFFNDDLQSMNRAHSATEAKTCLTEAGQYFDNITIDLIYGIPNMSLEKWNTNLETAFDFNINHISSYALTVEPQTALDTFVKKGTYPPINESLALQHFNHLIEKTTAQGFIHYEISNFGKPQYFSKHNTSYWQGKPYLGIGPSAHSFNNAKRSWNISNNTKYIQAIEANRLPDESEILSIKDQFNEYVMTGLRTIWGVSLLKIEQDFGLVYKDHIIKSIKKYTKDGLLILEPHYNNLTIKTTQKGKFLIDGIAADLFMI